MNSTITERQIKNIIKKVGDAFDLYHCHPSVTADKERYWAVIQPVTVGSGSESKDILVKQGANASRIAREYKNAKRNIRVWFLQDPMFPRIGSIYITGNHSDTPGR